MGRLVGPGKFQPGTGSHNRKLTASAGPGEHLILQGFSLDELGSLDVIFVAEAQLTLRVETGRVCRSSPSNKDGVVGPACDMADFPNAGHRDGAEADARSPTLVVAYYAGILKLLRAKGNAELPAIQTTPDETLSISGHGSRVMGSASQANHSLVPETWYLPWEWQKHFIAAGRLCIAGFTEAVQTPGSHLALLVNGKGVIVAVGNMLDVSDVDTVGGEQVFSVQSKDVAT